MTETTAITSESLSIYSGYGLCSAAAVRALDAGMDPKTLAALLRPIAGLMDEATDEIFDARAGEFERLEVEFDQAVGALAAPSCRRAG